MTPDSTQATDDSSSKLRFDWYDLPAATAHLPGTGGRIRSEIDDFVVTEIPSYLPSGAGDHVYAYLEKRGLATMDLVRLLQRQGVPERDVGFAGQKDKYAVTRQWVSVHEEYASQLETLADADGVELLEMSRHRNKLGLGHLRGNFFELRVRDPVLDWKAKAEAIIAHLQSVGLPNYFGPQRFGHFNTNASDAVRIIRGEKVAGGRRMHKFYQSALQSFIFNTLLKLRMEAGTFDSILSGDMAQKHETGGMFIVDDPAAESTRAQALEISAVLPMFGKKVKPSTGMAGEIEAGVLGELELEWQDFRSAHGARRASRVKLDEVGLTSTDDGYVVSFTLPKGSFATCLMRELMKTEEGEVVIKGNSQSKTSNSYTD